MTTPLTATKIATTLAVAAAVVSLLAGPAPAQDLDEIAPPSAPPDEPRAASPDAGERGSDDAGDDHADGPRSFHLGVEFVPLVWIPANKELSFQIGAEFRWTPSFPWSVVGDVSYIQIGESGSRLSEDGIGLYAGGQRSWAVGGDPATAKLFPTVRAGLGFEATSTRLTTSSKHIVLRAGPGLDWNAFGAALVNVGLEIGFGLLSTKAGSEGDTARFELTLGLAIRFLWGF